MAKSLLVTVLIGLTVCNSNLSAEYRDDRCKRGEIAPPEEFYLSATLDRHLKVGTPVVILVKLNQPSANSSKWTAIGADGPVIFLGIDNQRSLVRLQVTDVGTRQRLCLGELVGTLRVLATIDHSPSCDLLPMRYYS